MAQLGNSKKSKGHGTTSIPRRTFLGGAAITSASALMMSTAAQELGTVPIAEAQTTGGNVPAGSAEIMVGRGLADITGEPLGAGMNGYAVAKQQTSGLRLRQFSRAFIFGDVSGSRVVHVTADMGLMFESIFAEVVRRLQAKFGDRYNESNVLLSASHTHVGPGGTSGHLLVDITTAGFRPVTFEAAVAGIVLSIERADADFAPASVRLTRGRVSGGGVNRSRQAFELNPEEEKSLFPQGVDDSSTTLHVYRGGTEIGFINWYAVHPTSFGPEHTIIDGDNKGYAAWKTEHDHGVDHRRPAEATFVAAFAMSAPGDVSPNQGLVPHSGPGGEDEAASARIIGERQMAATPGQEITLDGSGISMVHKWVDLGKVQIDARFTPDGKAHATGPAVLGAAFAASSQEDGGGEPLLGFNEGERGGTPWLNAVNKVVVPSSAREIQGEKDMLLPVGYIDGLVQQTHMFTVVDIAGFTLVTNGLEPTTISGYRIRKLVAEALEVPIETVICQGYTNGYGHYVATPEEYAHQDYEGGATAFGKYTLSAMLQIYDELAHAKKAGIPVAPTQRAGDLTGRIPNALGGNPLIDWPLPGKKFGDVVDATDSVAPGGVARATFVFANPNSDLRHEDGYLLVKDSSGAIVSDDYHPDTSIEFAKQGETTLATVTWSVGAARPGRYSIEVRGSSRDMIGNLTEFDGRAVLTVG